MFWNNEVGEVNKKVRLHEAILKRLVEDMEPLENTISPMDETGTSGVPCFDC